MRLRNTLAARVGGESAFTDVRHLMVHHLMARHLMVRNLMVLYIPADGTSRGSAMERSGMGCSS